MNYHSQNRDRRSPNQKFAPARTKIPFHLQPTTFLPSEITSREIKIAQAKSIFPKAKINFPTKPQLTFSEAKSVFTEGKWPFTAWNYHPQNRNRPRKIHFPLTQIDFSAEPKFTSPKQNPCLPTKNDLLLRKKINFARTNINFHLVEIAIHLAKMRVPSK